MVRNLFLCLLFLSTLKTSAQLSFAKGFGGQIGVSLSMGTHTNRLGGIVKLFYTYEYIQLNLQAAAYCKFHDYAAKRNGWEAFVKAGLVGAWGEKQNAINPFLSEVSNQTGRTYALGYAYMRYFDSFQTSQASGSFSFAIGDFAFFMENDFLAFESEDRFRTGAVGLYYNLSPYTQLRLQHISWTGNAYAKGVEWISKPNEEFQGKWGYMNMKQAPYGDCSVGVLSLGVEQVLPYGQYIGASLGVDADQIRNFMQNRMIHDSKILPINWGDFKNPHIPMWDSNGEIYLHKKGQRIRDPRLYMQILLNDSTFY